MSFCLDIVKISLKLFKFQRQRKSLSMFMKWQIADNINDNKFVLMCTITLLKQQSSQLVYLLFGRYAYVETIVDSMAYLMHSSNFFLYCLTGAGFRRELKLMVSRWKGNSNIEDLTTTECTAAFN